MNSNRNADSSTKPSPRSNALPSPANRAKKPSPQRLSLPKPIVANSYSSSHPALRKQNANRAPGTAANACDAHRRPRRDSLLFSAPSAPFSAFSAFQAFVVLCNSTLDMKRTSPTAPRDTRHNTSRPHSTLPPTTVRVPPASSASNCGSAFLPAQPSFPPLTR